MKRASPTLRLLIVLAAFGGSAVAASCSSDSDEEPAPVAAAGAPGGAGSPGEVESIECGSNSCDGAKIALGGFDPLVPCCADGDACGLDSSFLADYGVSFEQTCQAKDQPGVLGQGCPDSPPLSVPNSTVMVPPLKGCCRTESETCGYQLDKLLGLIDVGLGCVDSSPFLDGGTAESCDPS